MNAYLPFVISGLVIGSVYAIASLGLVVTYRTTGLFNFAHGAVGMAVAFAFYQLRTGWGVPTWLAVVVSLGVVAPALGVFIDRALFRNLTNASQAAKVVVSMGLLIALQGVVIAHYGGATRQVAPFLPTSAFRLGSTYIGYDQVIIVAIALAVFAGLAAFFRQARVGVVMRAVVDDPALVEGAGFSSARVSMLTWALGCVLAGLAGILFTPLLGLDSLILTLLVVQAYAAAIFGRLTSLPRTAVAALGLGLANSLILKVLQGSPDLLNGLRPSLPFLFLFAVLVFAGPRALKELGQSTPWTGSVESTRSWRQVAAGALLLFLVVALMPGSRLLLLGLTLVFACAFLSLTALTGGTGLVSLTQAGLMGTGAFAYIHVVRALHAPFPIALLLAGLAAIPLGLVIVIPSLRLPSLFVALATFGLGELIDGLLFSSWHWFSGSETGLGLGRPTSLGGTRPVVFLAAAVVMVFVVLITAVQRSALSRRLRALRDSAIAAQTLGLNPLWPKVFVFSMSAFMAGVAGALYVVLLQVASKDAFTTFTSLFWITVVVVGGIDSPLGAIIGAFLFYFVPGVLSSGATASPWVTPLFGVAAIALAKQPGGLVRLVSDRLPQRLFATVPASTEPMGSPG